MMANHDRTDERLRYFCETYEITLLDKNIDREIEVIVALGREFYGYTEIL